MEKPWFHYLYIKSPLAKLAWGIGSTIVAIIVILIVGVMEESRMAAQTANWDGRSIEKGAEIYANNCYTCHGLDGHGGSGPALNSKHFFEQRIGEIGFTGTLEDFVHLTVAAGRPSNAHGQWVVVMPTWSSNYGGPLRPDQVRQVTDYVMNWESTAVLQTPEEDPWIPFAGVPTSTGGSTAAAGGEGEATEEVAQRSPDAIFAALGCAACHNLTLPEDENNRGLIGPNMANLADHAGSRVPGEDAVTYVHNSIANPSAFIVPGYQSGLMPAGLDARMTPEEFDSLVNWLLDPNHAVE